MSLSGLHIVLMRPREQNQKWQDNILAERADVSVLPMMDIIPMPIEHSMLDAVMNAQAVVITSQNGAIHAPITLINILIERKIPVLSIGKATTSSLMTRGIEPVYTAPNGAQSEDLLALPFCEAKRVRGKKIVLIVGKGGRELITQTLGARGAQIHTLFVYAQRPIMHELGTWFERWRNLPTQVCFLITSGNTLSHFESQVPEEHKTWLHAQPLVTISRRLVGLGEKYGFQHIFNTQGMDWACVLTTLQQVVKVCHTSNILI